MGDTTTTALYSPVQRIKKARTRAIVSVPALALTLSPPVEKVPVHLTQPTPTKCQAADEPVIISHDDLGQLIQTLAVPNYTIRIGLTRRFCENPLKAAPDDNSRFPP